MENLFLKKLVRRSNKNIFWVSFILLIILCTILYNKWGTFYNRNFGPFPIDLTEDVEIRGKQWYVTFTTDETIDLNQVAEKTTESLYFRNKKIDQSTYDRSKFIMGRVDTVNVIIEVSAGYIVPEDESGATFSGVLAKFPGDLEEFPEFVPYMLDASRVPKKSATWWYGIGGPICLIFLLLVFTSIRRMISPMSHPAVKRLKKIGNPQKVIQAVEKEMVNSKVIQIEDFRITDNWVIHSDVFSFNYIPIKYIKWIHGSRKKASAGSIPFASHFIDNVFFTAKDLTWDSKSLVIYTSYDEFPFDFECSEMENTAKLVELISQKTDKIIVGYAPDIKAMWNSSHRKALINLINNKKASNKQEELFEERLKKSKLSSSFQK